MTALSNIARSFFTIRPDRIHDLVFEIKRMPEGTVDIIGFNLAPIKNSNETTVSSSTWSTDDSNISIVTSSNTSITTQVTVSADSPGKALLKNTITMSDSQLIVRFIEIHVFKLNFTSDYNR